MTDKIDNGKDTIDTSGEQTDNRSQMLASVAAIAAASIRAENKLSQTAKQWGHSLFSAVYTDGGNLDALIGDSKVAAGWKTLSTSEAGRKTKQRLDVYFSNARMVAERYTSLTDDQRTGILNGTVSIHYLASEFRKADAATRKAAAKAAEAAKAGEAADEASDTTGTGEGVDLSTFTLAQLAEAMLNRYQLADNAEKAEAHPALELLVDAMNADIEADAKVLVADDEPEQIAA